MGQVERINTIIMEKKNGLALYFKNFLKVIWAFLCIFWIPLREFSKCIVNFFKEILNLLCSFFPEDFLNDIKTKIWPAFKAFLKFGWHLLKGVILTLITLLLVVLVIYLVWRFCVQWI